MALVKCKECGGQVSTKAKTCPSCGAKAPKQTSLFTWLVLGLIIYGVYASTKNQPESTVASAPVTNIQQPQVSQKVGSSAASSTAPSKPIEPIHSDWSVFNSADEMTGEKSSYASSLTVKSNKPMDFPYQDTEAWMGVGCNSKSEWVYIGFNNAPNLSDTETEDGYNVISTRIKWNGVVENVKLTQKWGAKFIHFENDAHAVSKILGSNSALLELQWHGQQPSYFEFSLNGAADAVKNLRKSCGRK